MNIAFLTSSLNAGGSERNIVKIANRVAGLGLGKVFIFTWGDEPSFYHLDPSIERICLYGNAKSSKATAILNNLRRIRKIVKASDKYKVNVLVSFITMNNVLSIIAGMISGLPVIVSERSNPFSEKIGTSWRKLRKLVYPFASQVVVQTTGAYNALVKSGHKDKNFTVIPNSVNSTNSNLVDFKDRRNNIIYLGRLTREKGCDLLIDAIQICKENLGSYQLLIYGDGPEKCALQSKVNELGLDKSVIFCGITSDSSSVLSQSKIFVLPSLHEGFPNALCEAMAHGLACISSDCEFGPSEIITQSINGILVPKKDSTAIAEALRFLISNELEAGKMGNRARNIVNILSENEILSKWVSIIISHRHRV